MKTLVSLSAVMILTINCTSQSRPTEPEAMGTTYARIEPQEGIVSPSTSLESEPARTDPEIIAEAIETGNCLVLSEYLQRGKKNTDPKLVADANAALRRYTTPDSWTPRYRLGKMDPKIRRIPKQLTEKVFVTPEDALPGITASLMSGITDNFLKAKILHDWICDNIAYDTEMYFSDRGTSNQDYVSVLKRKKAVCSGYAGLFNRMCELAGIASIGIQGYSKGFGYKGRIVGETDHEWNAVRVGNKWYLIDVTWDAGYVDRKTFIKRYSTEWLFLDPRPFLYSHLPAIERFQFYAPALAAEVFMREPYIKGKFFQYGLTLKSDSPKYDNTIEGGLTFELTSQNSSVLLSSLLRSPDQIDIRSASWVDRKGVSATFTFDVPDSNEYVGNIFARYGNESRLQDRIDVGTFETDWLPRSEQLFSAADIKDRKITETELNYFKASYFKVEENGAYYLVEDQFDAPRYTAVLKIHRLLSISTLWSEPVLDFKIVAAPGYAGFGRESLQFPRAFSTYHEAFNTRLIAPMTGSLKADSTETFFVASKDFTKLAAIIEDKFFYFTRNAQTGNFELTLEIPSDIDTMKISGTKGAGTQYWGLVQYEVIK